jgi:hypothetical protein
VILRRRRFPAPASSHPSRHNARFILGEPGLAEKKMFGGLAFLVGGNMAIAASGQGGLLVRA